MIPLLGTHGLFLLIAGIGAIAGSVANMLIYRLPRDLPIGIERSRCTTCNTPLTPLDLIPIFKLPRITGALPTLSRSDCTALPAC